MKLILLCLVFTFVLGEDADPHPEWLVSAPRNYTNYWRPKHIEEHMLFDKIKGIVLYGHEYYDVPIVWFPVDARIVRSDALYLPIRGFDSTTFDEKNPVRLAESNIYPPLRTAYGMNFPNSYRITVKTGYERIKDVYLTVDAKIVFLWYRNLDNLPTTGFKIYEYPRDFFGACPYVQETFWYRFKRWIGYQNDDGWYVCEGREVTFVVNFTRGLFEWGFDKMVGNGTTLTVSVEAHVRGEDGKPKNKTLVNFEHDRIIY